MSEKKEMSEPETGQPTPQRPKGRDPARKTARRGGRRGRRRVGVWAGLILGLFFLAPLVAGALLLDQRLRLPDWAEARISATLDSQGSAGRISLGDIFVTVGRDLRPWIELRNTVITRPDGAALARLGEMRVQLSKGALLRGTVAAERVELSGLVLDLVRGRDGSFDLAFRAGDVPLQQSASFSALMAGLDQALSTPELASLTSAEARTVTLRYSDVRADRVWTVDGGRLVLSRQGDSLRATSALTLLTGGATAATLEGNYTRTIGQNAAEFGLSVTDLEARDVASQAPVLSWLQALNAPLSGSLRGSVDSAGDLAGLSASLSIGAGALRPNAQTRPIPFRSARTYFTYDPANSLLQFDEIAVNSDWITGHAGGSARLIWGAGDWPVALETQVELSDLTVDITDLNDTPLEVQDAKASLRLNIAPFEITLGEMTMQLGDAVARLRGRVVADPAGWTTSLLAEMDSVTPDTVKAYWPTAAAPRTRRWVVDHVSDGTLRDVQFHVAASAGEKPDLHLEFGFDGASVRYVDTMPPITGASGRAVLGNRRFALALTGGQARPQQGGVLKLAGSRFEIPVLGPKHPDAVIDLDADGTVTGVLSLLDSDPLNVISKAGMAVTLADGRADVQGQLRLPLKVGIKGPDVDYDFTATLSDVRSSSLVPNRVLVAPTLNVSVRPDVLRIAGAGRLGIVPFDGVFTLPRGGTPAVQAKVEISERMLDEFGVDLGEVRVSGAAQGQLDLSFPKQAPVSFDLTSDLGGLGLRLSALGVSKSTKSTGALHLAGAVSPLSIDTLALSAPGLALNGRLAVNAAGKVTSVRFDRARLGRWLDTAATLTPRSGGRAPLVALNGGTLDVRAIPELGKGGGAGGPVKVTDLRVRLTDRLAVDGVSGSFTTGGGLSGAFAGRVNGGAKIDGDITPSRGRSAIRITSKDGGGVLRSAGVLEQAVGGALTLTLAPARQDGQYDGVLAITDTRVNDAPTVAALLNALSVVGLLDQMASGGIYFANVDAKFRLTPQQLILQQASAVGPSMGLSLDGVIGLTNSTLDLQGVLSPIYVLNGIGGFLTRRGEGLFGFNFTLRGPFNAPSIGVNPLSVLTPGMFREIFRRPPPVVSE